MNLHIVKCSRGLLALDGPFAYPRWTWQLGEAARLPKGVACSFADSVGGPDAEVVPLDAKNAERLSPLNLAPVPVKPIEVVRVSDERR